MTALLLLGAMILLGCGLLWYSNTSTINRLDSGVALAAVPGETVTVMLPEPDCAGPLVTFQRKGLFGRWQQTHVGQERRIVPWYRLGKSSLSSTMECVAAFEITVPVDVTWSPVAACSIDLDCFVIDVDSGGR